MARILLVDDDALVRRSIVLQLTRAGHTVVVAIDGRDALTASPFDELDLVITDIFMPVMEGLELVGRLRAEAPHLPVIVMTGGPTRSHAMTTAELGDQYLGFASKLGATRTIRKPFTPTALLALVQECLADRPEMA